MDITHHCTTMTFLPLYFSYVAVSQHGSFSLDTKLVGQSVAKLDIYFPLYGIWMILKSLSNFMVMTLGPCVKQPKIRS